MPTQFPEGIDTFDLGSPIPTDPKNDPSLSGEVTDLNDAVVAIERELGVVPSGTHASVAARLDSISSRVTNVETFVGAADEEYVNQAGDTMTGGLNVPNLGFTTEDITEASNSDAWPHGLVVQAGNSGSWFTLGEVININESSVRRGQIFLAKNGGMWIRGLDGNGPAFGPWHRVWTDQNDGAGSGLDADLLDGQSSAYYRNRANHTGTQLHTTISDFDTGVRQNRLNQLTVPNGNVNMNGYKFTNLGSPTGEYDAANRAFVDTRVSQSHIVGGETIMGVQDFSSMRTTAWSTISVPSHWNSWSLFATATFQFWTNEAVIEGVTATASFRISTPASNYSHISSQLDHGVISLSNSSTGTDRYGHMSLTGNFSGSASNLRLWAWGYYGDEAGLSRNTVGWEKRRVTYLLIRTS